MTETKEPEKSFEENLERLNAIVEELEAGNLTLEQALKLYEEGVRLGQLCSRRLEHVQSRIEILTRSAQGKLESREDRAAEAELKTRKKK